MGQRRMFSKRITDSARFLKMPNEAQCLYFHLCMSADDDGIVEAYPIIKKVGVPEDNFRTLVIKGFIKILNEDLVAYILDWNEHNLIRADRKVDSIYKNLLIQIIPDAKLLEAKPRADTGKTTGRPVDGRWTAQGKVSEDKIESPLPPLEKGDKEGDLSLEETIIFWNSKRTTADILINGSSLKGKVRNKTADSKLLPQCREITGNIRTAWRKLKINKDKAELAIKNYINEIINRNPATDYANHRFSFYEFLKQSNGFQKFINK